MLFRDRAEAGKRLAEEIAQKGYAKPLVLALPRGGVPIGSEVAEAISCPFDTLVVRKVGTPLNPEFAVGAVAPHDVVLLDDEAIKTSGSSRIAVEGVIGREREELRRRIDVYKSGQFSLGYVPRTVIVVDDGVATGMTAQAALIAARTKYTKARIVFASPLCLGNAEKMFRNWADETICLASTPQLFAISQAYASFEQVSDQEVLRILELEAKYV